MKCHTWIHLILDFINYWGPNTDAAFIRGIYKFTSPDQTRQMYESSMSLKNQKIKLGRISIVLKPYFLQFLGTSLSVSLIWKETCGNFRLIFCVCKLNASFWLGFHFSHQQQKLWNYFWYFAVAQHIDLFIQISIPERVSIRYKVIRLGLWCTLLYYTTIRPVVLPFRFSVLFTASAKYIITFCAVCCSMCWFEYQKLHLKAISNKHEIKWNERNTK